MTQFDNIRQWAGDRNLILGSDPTKQMLKLTEEVGELAAAIARGNDGQTIDAIGDIVVVLTILAAQKDLSIEYCIDSAWGQIKDRKGVMRDGIFVKEEV